MVFKALHKQHFWFWTYTRRYNESHGSHGAEQANAHTTCGYLVPDRIMHVF